MVWPVAAKGPAGFGGFLGVERCWIEFQGARG